MKYIHYEYHWIFKVEHGYDYYKLHVDIDITAGGYDASFQYSMITSTYWSSSQSVTVFLLISWEGSHRALVSFFTKDALILTHLSHSAMSREVSVIFPISALAQILQTKRVLSARLRY